MLKCSGRHPYSVNFLIRTPVFEWYSMWLVTRLRTHTKTTSCVSWRLYLCASNMITIKGSIVNVYWGDLYDHVMSIGNLHFDNKYDVYMGFGNFLGKVATSLISNCEFHIVGEVGHLEK